MENDLTDTVYSKEEIISKFTADSVLMAVLADETQRKLFYRVAIAGHNNKLDWWIIAHAKKGQLRVGHNNYYGEKKGGLSFVCEFEVKNSEVICRLNSKWIKSENDLWQPLTEEFVTKFESMAFLPEYVSVLSSYGRDGNWPDVYTETDNNLETLNYEKMTNKNSTKPDLNQILFGPPGTGKTYATIEETIKIVKPELYQENPDNTNEYRQRLKSEFDNFVASKQVRFVTFHQSFSYEDFVEGLRAKSDDGKLSYSVESGVFKELCEQALIGVAPENDFFEQAKNRFIEKFKDCEELAIIETEAQNKKFDVLLSEDENSNTFYIRPHASAEQSKSIRMTWSYIRSVYLGINKKKGEGYVCAILNYLSDNFDLPEYTPQPVSEKQNFVLIIDEINRGNISRIFGELITLIEDSKRAGSEEKLEVILPYSKKSFSVPENLYILGTMNTADRSLAGLDIALRRRFTFIEMPPKPELLDKIIVSGGIDIGQMLRVMNQRIEVLLDANHCIGHAYFMPLKKEASLERLSHIFKQKIIPLLQEYFFEDWQRIHWILNDHNKHTATQFIVKNKNLEPLKLFGSTVGLPEQLDRWELNQSAFDLPESYFGIYSDASTLSNDKANEEPHE